jgi:hypothetical protein
MTDIEKNMLSKYEELVNSTTLVVKQMGLNCEVAIDNQNRAMVKLIENMNMAIENIIKSSGSALEASSNQLSKMGEECLREFAKENLAKQKRDHDLLIAHTKDAITKNVNVALKPLSEAFDLETDKIKKRIKLLDDQSRAISSQIKKIDELIKLLNNDIKRPIGDIKSDITNIKKSLR